MTAYVYILYSALDDSFYTGATTIKTEKRLNRHLDEYYENKFTSKLKDWELFLEIECFSMKQALLIEKHIKRMKSKVYIANLKKHPLIIGRLKEKYSAPDS
ncbi:MAG: GIY-YIG nuclease family protein [Chitinophagaceae bacterium]|nr:GIY-YIG nuclease family protein [Chitinophagaceae bacterium]